MTRNTLKDLWQNIKKREREVEEEDSGTLEDKDIILEIDRETLLQEYIPKADYEARLRADMVAMLEEIILEIDEMDCTIDHDFEGYYIGHVDCQKLIREKINALKADGSEDGT